MTHTSLTSIDFREFYRMRNLQTNSLSTLDASTTHASCSHSSNFMINTLDSTFPFRNVIGSTEALQSVELPEPPPSSL